MTKWQIPLVRWTKPKAGDPKNLQHPEIKMKTIVSEEFKRFVEVDPAWASKLTAPVEITDFCDMKGANITHLSPLLTFSGQDKNGNVASFSCCQHLKIAEGTFVGMVTFSGSCLEKIGHLSITQPNNHGEGASFCRCRNLKVAEGCFAGSVDFTDSGVEKISNLITHPNKSGTAAEFRLCRQLTVAEGTYPGYVDFSDSYLEKIGNLTITQSNDSGDAASFAECKGLSVANGSFAGFVDFQGSGIAQIGKLTIAQPNDQGQYLCVEWCPISENTTELAKVFSGKSLDELAVGLQRCQYYSVTEAIKQIVGRLVLKKSKNAQPDFEL